MHTVVILITSTYTIVSEMKTLRDAELALRPYVPLVAQLSGGNTTLERIEPLMKLIGNPEDRLRIIHIAGTSGKTSTSYYIAGLMQATGSSVGLTVSPHVDKISERVQINGQPLSDAEFCSELGIFLRLIQTAAQTPSYFELLYAFSLWVFDRRGVDYAVIETGMGGLYDATNVAKRADKVCVITDIGYDHMHVLGNTLPEIAAQKIGIVHNQNVAITYRQSDEIMNVFRDWAWQRDSSLIILDQGSEQTSFGETLEHMPAYQRRNWLLAHHAYQFVRDRDQLTLASTQAVAMTQLIQIPARMEIVARGGKTLVMDGAHNEQKMQAFVSSFQQRFPGIRPAVLVALKTGKEYQAVSPILSQLTDTIIVTTFDTSQDLPAHSMDTELFAGSLRKAGIQNVTIVPDHRLAYDTLMQNPHNVCVITGSFYLLSQLRSEVSE